MCLALNVKCKITRSVVHLLLYFILLIRPTKPERYVYKSFYTILLCSTYNNIIESVLTSNISFLCSATNTHFICFRKCFVVEQWSN